MTIIDTHAHIYPDAIALKAAKSTGTFYDIPMCLDGTLGQLMAHGEAAGISRFLVHSVAVTPSRVHSINDYLMRVSAEHPDRLIGFGTLHPDYEDVPGELDRIKAGGEAAPGYSDLPAGRPARRGHVPRHGGAGPARAGPYGRLPLCL